MRVAYVAGDVLRFRRYAESTARSEGVPPREGRHSGAEFRLFSDYVLRARVSEGGQPPTAEVRIADCAVEMHGVGGDLAFDTKRPETLRALESTRDGPAVLRAIEATRSQSNVVVLAADGTLVMDEAEIHALALATIQGVGGTPFAIQFGGFPGSVPVGRMEGTATPGRSWPFAAVLRVGLAGLRYDDPLPVTGTWTVASWDPDARIARLVLTGGPQRADIELRTTRVESCELSGEAVWDASRSLVTEWNVTARVALRSLERRNVRIDWKLSVMQRALP